MYLFDAHFQLYTVELSMKGYFYFCTMTRVMFWNSKVTMAQSAKPEKKVFTNIRIAATGDFDYFITDFSYAHPPPPQKK